MQSPHALYSDAFPREYGHAFWLLEPNDLPYDYFVQGVQIGDVLVLTPDGGYDYLFNICRPKDDPVNAGRTYEGFEPLPLDLVLETSTRARWQNVGSCLGSSGGKMFSASASASAPGLPVPVGAGVGFSTSHSSGALLILPDGASRTDLRNHRRFKDWITRNIHTVFEHVNGDQFGREASSVFIVTGCDKSTESFVAASTNASDVHKAWLNLNVANVGVDLSYSSSLQCPSSTRVTPVTHSNDGTKNKNHCAFARGLTCTKRRYPVRSRITIKVGDLSTDQSWDVEDKSGGSSFWPFSSFRSRSSSSSGPGSSPSPSTSSSSKSSPVPSSTSRCEEPSYPSPCPELVWGDSDECDSQYQCDDDGEIHLSFPRTSRRDPWAEMNEHFLRLHPDYDYVISHTNDLPHVPEQVPLVNEDNDVSLAVHEVHSEHTSNQLLDPPKSVIDSPSQVTRTNEERSFQSNPDPLNPQYSSFLESQDRITSLRRRRRSGFGAIQRADSVLNAAEHPFIAKLYGTALDSAFGGQTYPQPHVQPTPPTKREPEPMPGAFPVAGPAYPQPHVRLAPPTKHEPEQETSFNFPPVVKAPAIPEGPTAPQYDQEEYVGELAAQATSQLLNVIPNIRPLDDDEDNYDDQGNYHGRGRDTFQGPRAKADDIDQFLVVAGNAEQFDGNASVDDALKKLGLANIYEVLPNMEVALMPHQTIGVAWMLDREQGPLKGGCLGDDMGLGKTVQMIALLVKNPSTSAANKTNLIIAPAALLDQWKFEIELKTNESLKCLVYHGSGKARSKKELLKYDVVLTTYNTMALEWPDYENEEKKKKKKKKQQDFIVSDDDSEKEDKKKKQKGLLFQVEFYRIVLDEAQVIRNKMTRVSRAVTALEATYRWCLTGTPIVNGLGDAYPYLRFLKIRPWYDFAEFRDHVGRLEKKRPDLAVTKLQAIFATFVLRRMKDSMLDGRKLVELPNKSIHLVNLNFSDEEREVYNFVEARSQASFNRYLRAGTVLKNYHQVLVLLLRLRQICCHPSLIQQGEGNAFVTAAEFEEHEKGDGHADLTRARRSLGPDFVAKMKEKFKEIVLRRMAAEKESADAAIEDEECPICFDAFNDAVVTSCGHVYCRECLSDVLNAPLPEAAGDDGAPKLKANERPCPACRTAISFEQIFSRSAFEPTDEELNPAEESDVEMADIQPRKGKSKRKSSKKKAHREADESIDVDMDSDGEAEEDNYDSDMSDFIVQSDEDEEEKDARREVKKKLGGKRKAFVVVDSDDEIDNPEDADIIFGKKKTEERKNLPPQVVKLLPKFLPSTKMKWMMDRIKSLAEEKPDEKILVVSQWTSCLSLVSDYLGESGIVHVKFQGDMTRPKRDQAVRAFMTNEKVKVMLMSLKCGGVGLNLVRANNVISLDLGWSQAVEAQAFDRVHRLGQQRDVDVRRLVIANTVEDRILQLQLRKQDLADGSLGEGKGKKIGRLTVRELARLFGLDARGRRLDPED